MDEITLSVKASGNTPAKVFLGHEFTLAAGETPVSPKRQTIRNYTTQKDHAGRHRIELQVKGRIMPTGRSPWAPNAISRLALGHMPFGSSGSEPQPLVLRSGHENEKGEADHLS